MNIGGCRWNVVPQGNERKVAATSCPIAAQIQQEYPRPISNVDTNLLTTCWCGLSKLLYPLRGFQVE